jgi:hypothetical protein
MNPLLSYPKGIVASNPTLEVVPSSFLEGSKELPF